MFRPKRIYRRYKSVSFDYGKYQPNFNAEKYFQR